MQLEVYLLGRFDVRRNGQPVQDWRRAAARQLFKRLVLAPHQRLPAEGLAQAMWPHDAGERARQRLHHLLYLLRGVLRGEAGEAAALSAHDGVVHLASTGLWLDVQAFDAAADLALRPGAGLPALQRAATLYGGLLLPGDQDDADIAARRTRLEQRYLAVLQALADAQHQAGGLAEAEATLQQLVARAPADEAAHRALMALHAQAQRRDAVEQQYLACRAALAAELGVAPSPATHQAYRQAMLGAPPGAPGAEAAPATTEPVPLGPRLAVAPPLVPLIDRDTLLADIQARLLQPGVRLLTLLGDGGLGKTQLALHAAYALQGHFAQGACVVSLAEVGEDGVLDRLRRALGLPAAPAAQPAEQALAEALRSRQLLLVLDNAEHVAARLGLLTELLAQAPQLRLLVTSRRRLNLRVEQVLAVPALAAEPGSAMRLFTERARAAAPGLVLGEAEQADVRGICQRLGGVPLAIELVAARAAVVGLPALRQALDSSLALASGGGPDRPARQRSLQASLRWSLGLLSAPEQGWLQAATLFAAPFEAAALLALQPVADAAPAEAALASLLELGLLVRQPASGGLHLPPALREELAAAQPAPEVQRRFVAWHADAAARLAAQQGPAAQAAQAAQAALEAGHENFFAALALAQRLGDAAALCGLVRALAGHWARTGAWARADAWVRLSQVPAAALPAPEHAAWALAAAGYWHEGGRHAAARSLAQAALEQAERAGDATLQARAALLLSSALAHLGQAEAAIAPVQRVLALASTLGDPALRRAALNNLGNSHLAAGQLALARRAWEDGDAEFGGALVQARVAFVHNLALAAHYGGRTEPACRLVQVAAELEHSATPRPQRLALIHARQAWIHACNQQPDAAEAALALAARAADAAHLETWQRLCAAQQGQVALLRGHLARAAALLQQGVQACAAQADPWDLLDLQLWLCAARGAAGAHDEAAAGLATLVASHGHAWRHEHPRLLEAAAAVLAARGRWEPAARAWREAAAWRAQRGFRRFAVDQPRARRTLALLRARVAAAALAPAAEVPAQPMPLAWLQEFLC